MGNESFANQQRQELGGSINAVASKMDAVVSELEELRDKLVSAGLPYKKQAKYLGVWADSISSQSEVMREFPHIWQVAEVDQ